jgi:hypothetical protein
MFYDILDTLNGCNLVAVINASDLEDAKEKAVDLGYDLEYYRVEESEDE